MTKKDFQKATETFKVVVPLMIKNQTPATPQNYKIWYAYVQKSLPSLNAELDNIINKYGVCLPSHNEKLYRSYFATPLESDIRYLNNKLEVLVNEVSLSIQDTINDTVTFETSLEENISKLTEIEDKEPNQDELITYARSIAKHSEDIKNSTRHLNKQITEANSEISKLKQELIKVQSDAFHDSLSGLLNRGAFDKALSAYCTSQLNNTFCLVMLDIDNFKQLNDTYGHVFGDLIIQSIAKKLKDNCKIELAAYRFGGEEFALIIPNTSLEIATKFAETVRQSIEKISVKNKRTNEQIGNISASFGVCLSKDEESTTALIDRADQLLYQAKSKGKNCVVSA